MTSGWADMHKSTIIVLLVQINSLLMFLKKSDYYPSFLINYGPLYGKMLNIAQYTYIISQFTKIILIGEHFPVNHQCSMENLKSLKMPKALGNL